MRPMVSKVAIATAALAIVCGAAVAQNDQEVQVQATRMVNARLAGRSPIGVPILDFSLSYRVNLADLDLSTSSGAKVAEQRVEIAARAACKEISRQYPRATPSDRECAKAASDAAITKVHELVAAAETARHHG